MALVGVLSTGLLFESGRSQRRRTGPPTIEFKTFVDRLPAGASEDALVGENPENADDDDGPGATFGASSSSLLRERPRGADRRHVPHRQRHTSIRPACSTVILFLEDEYGIHVQDQETMPENLETISRIAAFVAAQAAAGRRLTRSARARR